MKKITSFILIILAMLSFAACGSNNGCTEVSLGENLPTWGFADTLYPAELPADASETGLTDIYKSDRQDIADAYIYHYPKEEGITLEAFGQQQAADRKVFCNMTAYGDVPAANVTYYETAYGADNIVRSYIFEAEDEFVKVCSVHKTERIALGESDYTVAMPGGYTETENAESIFPYEKVYTYEDEFLPTVRVRQFAKDYFTEALFDADRMEGMSGEVYEACADQGWTLAEFVDLYGDRYKLLKGETFNRNGLDVGFVGYIDEGVFYVRALIDCGDDYIMLCAENDAAIFQHVVNALIDTVE